MPTTTANTTRRTSSSAAYSPLSGSASLSGEENMGGEDGMGFLDLGMCEPSSPSSSSSPHSTSTQDPTLATPPPTTPSPMMASQSPAWDYPMLDAPQEDGFDFLAGLGGVGEKSGMAMGGGINLSDISSPSAFDNMAYENAGAGLGSGSGSTSGRGSVDLSPMMGGYEAMTPGMEMGMGGMDWTGGMGMMEESAPVVAQEEIVVKQEPLDPLPRIATPYNTSHLPTNFTVSPSTTAAPVDPFTTLGLTPSQQRDLLRTLVSSLTAAQNQTSTLAPSTVAPNAIAGPSRSSAPAVDDEPRMRSLSSAEPEQKRPRAMSSALLEAPLPLPAAFGGVKGKGGKKGGGMSSVVLMGDEEVGEDDDWRPTPEEYKKLSSKEKRQLRNKLSARAFRNRRKDYIGELEDHIKDRDRLIDAIREELKSAQGERDELRQEINALKKAAMVVTPMALQEPRPSAAIASPAPAVAPKLISRVSSPLNLFNPRKDLPSSASLALGGMSPSSMRGFWGSGSDNAFGSSGYTSVHTALTPDLTLPHSNMKMPALPPNRTNPAPQLNMNPLLNAPGARTASGFVPAPKADGMDLSEGFDTWSELNGFNHKNLEAYRMQLWSRMARDNALAKQGVPVEMRPKFYREPTFVKSEQEDVKPLSASAANQASQVVSSAISTRLLSAFVSAFQNSTNTGLDGDKVSAVFTGRSKLSIVPNPPTTAAPINEKSASLDPADALEHTFANLKLAEETSFGSVVVPKTLAASGLNEKCGVQGEKVCGGWNACCDGAAVGLGGVFSAVHRGQLARA